MVESEDQVLIDMTQRDATIGMDESVLTGLRPKRRFHAQLLNFVMKKPLGAVGAGVGIILIVVAILAPAIDTHNVHATDTANLRAKPSADHLLGTDWLGRDIYSRLIHGAKVSLIVGLLSSVIGCSIGLFIGVTSAYFGGAFDLFAQRLIDGLMAFPAIILAIAIMTALGGSIQNVIIALTVLFVPATARVIRSQALALREQDYILAARSIGARDVRIILLHMVPNTMAVFIVLVTFYMAAAIIAEAALSFLGVGIPITEPSWGGMLNKVTYSDMRQNPWLGVVPGLTISIVVLSWNMLGDALRDVLDPRMRGSQ